MLTCFIFPGIFLSKDRKVEVIEVEEPQQTVYIPALSAAIPILPQGEFMKGCDEKGEQGFLFQLYSKLTSGSYPCPNGCGSTFTRKNYDFFAIYVSYLPPE
jgi:hypothetical protein